MILEETAIRELEAVIRKVEELEVETNAWNDSFPLVSPLRVNF